MSQWVLRFFVETLVSLVLLRFLVQMVGVAVVGSAVGAAAIGAAVGTAMSGAAASVSAAVVNASVMRASVSVAAVGVPPRLCTSKNNCIVFHVHFVVVWFLLFLGFGFLV